MQVVILAGGLGTRLSEETGSIPKPMVRIGDLPILVHLMRFFSSYGHTDFVIALGYKGYLIKEYFANFANHISDFELNLIDGSIHYLNAHDAPWKVKLIDTGETSQTGQRVKMLGQFLENEFFLTYGDGLSDVNLDQLVQTHRNSNAVTTLTAVKPQPRFGSLEIEGDWVNEFSEKSLSKESWINGGFMFTRKSILDYIVGNEPLEDGALKRLSKENKLAAFSHHGFWHPMDTLRDKNNLQKLWSDGLSPWKPVTSDENFS